MEANKILLVVLVCFYIVNARPNSESHRMKRLEKESILSSKLSHEKGVSHSITRREGKNINLTRDEEKLEVRQTQPACGVPQGWKKALNDRVVGGSWAILEQHPWIVSLLFKSSNHHFCGGTIYDGRHVITAAHCVDNGVNPEHIEVLAGGYEEFEVEKIMLHKDFDPVWLWYDVAVLRLKTSIEFEYYYDIVPICPPTSCESMDYENCKVAGWGRTSYYGEGSDFLLEASIDVVASQECINTIGPMFDDDVTVCGKTPGVNVCFGDSGGPLTCQNEYGEQMLAGIISWTVGCDPDHVSGYARACEHWDWIEDKANSP